MHEMHALTIVDSSFWIKLITSLSILTLVFFIMNILLRKLFQIEKQTVKHYDKNHVNDRHKKWDWALRIISITLIIIGYFVNINRMPDKQIALLEPWNLMFMLIASTEILRAFFQWKDVKKQRVYLFTITRLIGLAIIVILFFVIIEWTSFFD